MLFLIRFVVNFFFPDLSEDPQSHSNSKLLNCAHDNIYFLLFYDFF